MARSIKKSPLNWLDEASAGIYFLRPDGCLGYANAALCEWLGATADEIVGRPCQFAVFPPSADRLAGLAPPPNLPLDAPTTLSICAPERPGKASQAEALFIPLTTSSGDAKGWWVWVAWGSHPSRESLLQDVESPELLTPQGLRAAAAELIRRAAGRSLDLRSFVGVSPEAERIRRAANWVAAGDADVLIWGPVGVGRFTLAQGIALARGGSPPVVVDCSVVEAESLQRILSRTCRELPENDRQILLKHVDQLSGEAAAELKGFLNLPNRHLRILATARQPLIEMAPDGEFDHHLAHRLSTIAIHIPPLRSRSADIPLLAQAILEDCRDDLATPARSFAPSVLQAFTEYPWPGEVAELKATIEQAARICRQSQILPGDLPERFRFAHQAAMTPYRGPTSLNLDAYLAEIERRLIERALLQARWNRAEAARALAVSRGRLIRRAEQLGIQFPAEEIAFEEVDGEP